MKIDEPLIDRMKLFLDFAARKQRAITSNLANAETPGYRAKEVNFEDVLAEESQSSEELKTTRSNHLPGKPILHRTQAVESPVGDTLGNDGNDVDMEKEITQLAENVLGFGVMGRLLQGKLQILKQGIKEGRG